MPDRPHRPQLSWATLVEVAFGLVILLGGILVLLSLRHGPPRIEMVAPRSAAFEELKARWQAINARHWQLRSPTAGEEPELTDQQEQTRGSCPTGMVEVRGKMKLDPSPILYAWARIERMQMEACTDYLSRTWPVRCRTYDRELWLKVSANLKVRPMHFCIDRYEYPNRKGEYPLINITWREAVWQCKAQGRRLCTEDEWTFACEGEEAWPYPYGYARDAGKCAIDRKPRSVNQRALAIRLSDASLQEIDRLWQGDPSGVNPECRSPFGVYDLTGNVDEWTRSVHRGERPSIMKGGYWGPGQNRCRASTRAHYEDFLFYQQGFRCCADLPERMAGGERSGQ